MGRDALITFRCDKGVCKACKDRHQCFSDSYTSRIITRHIYQDSMDRAEAYRKSVEEKIHYSGRKETIERVFAACKEQHRLRYTRLRGIEKVTDEVYLIFACHNLKNIINRLERMA